MSSASQFVLDDIASAATRAPAIGLSWRGAAGATDIDGAMLLTPHRLVPPVSCTKTCLRSLPEAGKSRPLAFPQIPLSSFNSSNTEGLCQQLAATPEPITGIATDDFVSPGRLQFAYPAVVRDQPFYGVLSPRFACNLLPAIWHKKTFLSIRRASAANGICRRLTLSFVHSHSWV